MKNNKKNNDRLVSTVIEKEKKNNNRVIIISLVIIIIVLLICIFLMLLKPNKEKCPICSSVTIKEVEVEPKYQLINYNGFRFKMPLNWNFVSTDNKYEISDVDSKLFISFNYYDTDYSLFSSKEYQRMFLESLQTSGDIKIDSSEELEFNKSKYIVYYGTSNSYNYMLVAIGNEEKIILISSQFVDKLSFDNMKNSVIDFVLSSF